MKEAFDILTKFNFVFFPLVKGGKELAHYDICFVEGAITNKEQIFQLKKLRKKTEFLVAFGTCATYGGITTISDFDDKEELIQEVYGSDKKDHSLKKVFGIGNWVKVDYYMRGCPVIKTEVLEFVKGYFKNTIPKEHLYPVCVECRQKGNPCLLAEKHLPCLGAITYGGCKALCTSQGIPCQGCRGPLPTADVDSRVNVFEKFGISKEDIRRTFIKFAGTSKKYRRIIKKLE
jgi:coenzyme F420-reducing hydrogenase gamma subunit